MASEQKIIEFILKAKNQLSGPLGKAQKGLKSVGNTIFSLKGLIAGVGVAALAKSFVEAANTSEQLRVRLGVLLGSVGEGNRLFKSMSTYASEVPFEFEEIMQSATNLAGILEGGVEEINQWVPRIGDLAAATGLGIQETTEQVQRMLSAGAASADKFREKGTLAMLGFTAGVSYSAEETKRMLIDALEGPNSRIKGATAKLATTWQGLMSMLADKWFAFRNLIMDSGIMDYLKAVAKVINDYLKVALDDATKSADVWGKTATSWFDKVIDSVGFMADMVRGLNAVWSGLQVVFAKIGESFWVMVRSVTDAYVGMRKFFDEDYKPKGFLATLPAITQEAAKRTAELKKEFMDLVAQPMPSTAIDNFKDKVKSAVEEIKEAREAAEADTTKTKQRYGGEGQYGSKEEESVLLKNAKENMLALEMDRETYAQKIIDLQEYFLEEEQIVQMKYEQDLLMLENANMLEQISDQQHVNMKKKIEEKYLEDMAKTRKNALVGSYKFGKAIREMELVDMLDASGEMLSNLSTTSKTAFRIQKAMALAKAVVSLPSAVIQSYENGGGYPWGIIPAGLMLLTGLAQISKIKSTSFSGQAHDGMTNVPREGTYLLDKGERVLSPSQNNDLTSFMNNGSKGGVTIDNLIIHVLENATNADMLLQMNAKDIEEIMAQKFIPALDALDASGIRQHAIERIERT